MSLFMSSPAASGALVFVTGASSGIGRALAREVPLPARVVGISRRAPPAGVLPVVADLADPEGWSAAARCFEDELAGFAGSRVVLWHCAGSLDPVGFAGEVDPGAYRRAVLLDAAAPLVLGDAFLRALRGRSLRADLVLISSGAATRVYEGWSAYGAGKAALDHWVRTVGAEQERRGGRCRVLALAPGVVETPMQERLRKSAPGDFPALGRFQELHTRGELLDPEDVARQLWALLERELPNGSVLDLRSLEDA
jgi:NAD(P)-dependent dehydrogenase (short-subunit alcohol dehydrogenase family)